MKNKQNHNERKHAKLSASGSSRWINCPGSVAAEEPYGDKSSVYANEGTLAHEISDYCLKNEYDADYCLDKKLKYLNIKVDGYKSSHAITEEMADMVQEYLDYVRSHETMETVLFTEQRVDFSNIVPDGFGTLDSAVMNPVDNILHIIDAKFGRGFVDAKENTQGILYALGMYNEMGFLYDFDSVRIHIAQPKIKNFSSWDISVKDLMRVGEQLKENALIALKPDAPRIAGDKQCEWCKASGNCKEQLKYMQGLLKLDFDVEIDDFEDGDKVNDRGKLSIKEKVNLFNSRKFIEKILNMNATNLHDLLSTGNDIPTLKLVLSSPNRKWKDSAEKKLKKLLKKEAYNKKLIGLGEAEKKIGKDKVSKLTYTPEGVAVMVHESDTRKKIITQKISDDFKDDF